MKLTLLQHNIVRGSVIFVSLTAKFAFGRALPPIHFGRAPLTECALRYPPCQSGTFLVSPWQDDVSIRFLWHIDCQSDFDEPVSMASRPVDRGFCRRGSVSTSFHPVKRHFGRRKSISTTFRPPKGGFGRTAEPKMPFYPPKGGFCRMGNAMVRGAGAPEKQKLQETERFLAVWCPKPGSNRHVFKEHWILSPARLPIPPFGHRRVH